VIEDMIQHPELKHIRFNKRENIKIGSDAVHYKYLYINSIFVMGCYFQVLLFIEREFQSDVRLFYLKVSNI